VICSASPELFFSLRDRQILSKPMKGTAVRGRTLDEDEANARGLYESEKNRAENVMIVDMIRNDLGRIAQPGSVVVTKLFDVEKYATVWQMTSTVEAVTTASLPDILKALFPCASITGAPKVKTMEIISALETTPRNVYTGAIGFFSPERYARFSVAIRTTLLDTVSNRAQYGVGGGIVWDSTAGEEYEECLNKAKIVLDPPPSLPFRLLETLLWEQDRGYFLLSRHCERLRASARYFDYPYDDERIQKNLADVSAMLAGGDFRVRLLLARDGTVECQAAPLDPPVECPLLLRLALKPVKSQNPFLYHKTTQRQVYEEAKAPFPDADDVLLYNEAGEVTESSIANVVFLRNGKHVTPPVRCGLLNGVYRQELLDRGEIFEEVIDVQTVRQAERFYLINSVRKWREARLNR
jgi:para-aminobenzoate synthetase / 4-amino-4-deoxychorismate lyase